MSNPRSTVSTELCPNCETRSPVEVTVQKEIIRVRNEAIEIDAEIRRCHNCRETFAEVNQEQRNFLQAYKIYRQKHGLLQPDEIRALREQYGLGQRAFSRLFGWGDITVHRYENGGLQDETHNNELLLLKDPTNFRLLYERNKDRLPATTRLEVETRLEALLSDTIKWQFRSWAESFFGEAREDICSGFRYFDVERFENAVLYLCSNISNLTKTKLNKLLWYCDFLNFRLNGRSLTGTVYVHLPYGPVPKNYECCLAYLTARKLITSEEEIIPSRGFSFEVYNPLEKPDLSMFSENEKSVFSAVVSRFGRMKARKIVDISHAQQGYVKTAPNEVISYLWAEELDPKDFGLNPSRKSTIGSRRVKAS